MTKMEQDIVVPRQPMFCKRFVDDIINRRKKNEPDELFSEINNYHENIRFTIEICPTKFLEIKYKDKSIVN